MGEKKERLMNSFIKRPRYFTFLSLLFIYLSVGSVVALHLSLKYGIAQGILGIIYGWSALASAIGLWIFRPWVLKAIMIWSISFMLRLFYYQYGLNGEYTLPIIAFIIACVICFVLLALLFYYVKRGLPKGSSDKSEIEAERLIAAPPAEQKSLSVKQIIFPTVLFLVISFINFATAIYLISRNLVPVACCNALLNLIPIYFLAKYFVAPFTNRRSYILFWIAAIALSMVLVVPYGSLL